MKFNSNASFVKETGNGAMGVVCRDEKGKVLTMAATRLFASNPFVAEAMRIREAMQIGRNLHL